MSSNSRQIENVSTIALYLDKKQQQQQQQKKEEEGEDTILRWYILYLHKLLNIIPTSDPAKDIVDIDKNTVSYCDFSVYLSRMIFDGSTRDFKVYKN